MSDKEAIIKLIKLVIDETYANELETLRWLFRKLEELGEEEISEEDDE